MMDEQFPAKFLYYVDKKFQRFLKQCRNASNRSEVDDNVLNFSQAIEDVIKGRFNMRLPPVFQMIDNSTSGDTLSKKGDKPNKKAKKEKQSKDRLVKNNDQLDDFKMSSTETWENDFCGKAVRERPDWDDNSKMCAKWHIKGDCYEDL
eukprot:13671028-Ditylum_brightwellii.AAC.1